MRTALSGDDWRPGFAKRAPNFDAVCAQARAWRWQPGVSVARIAAAVLKGTPTLTVQQRMTLLLYVEHLNQDRLEQDVATVWPGTSLIADYLGWNKFRNRSRSIKSLGKRPWKSFFLCFIFLYFISFLLFFNNSGFNFRVTFVT